MDLNNLFEELNIDKKKINNFMNLLDEQLESADFSGTLGAVDENEFLNLTAECILIYTKQLNLKYISRIELTIESMQYPFPPVVYAVCKDEKIEYEFYEMYQKEKRYEFEAVCADFNLECSENDEKILDLYNRLIHLLKEFDWNSFIKVKDDFDIVLIK